MSYIPPLSAKQAARYLHVSTRTLQRWRTDGVGPKTFKPGDALNSPIMYELSDLNDYIKASKGGM